MIIVSKTCDARNQTAIWSIGKFIFPSFTWFYRVSPGFTGMTCTTFFKFFLLMNRFQQVFMRIYQFHLNVLLMFRPCHLLHLFTGFYWVLPGFIGILLSIVKTSDFFMSKIAMLATKLWFDRLANPSVSYPVLFLNQFFSRTNEASLECGPRVCMCVCVCVCVWVCMYVPLLLLFLLL